MWKETGSPVATLVPVNVTGVDVPGSMSQMTLSAHPFLVRATSPSRYVLTLGSNRAYSPPQTGDSPTTGPTKRATFVGCGEGPGHPSGALVRCLAILTAAGRLVMLGVPNVGGTFAPEMQEGSTTMATINVLRVYVRSITTI